MPAEVPRVNLASKTDARSNMVSVIDSLRSIVQALRASSREAEQKFGISSAQLFVLQELQSRPAMSINDLAERTFTHQSSVSMVVSKLVENRLVTRSAARNDARRLSISLTPAGKAMLRRSPNAAQTTLIAALKGMTQTELRSLAGALTNLSARIAEQEAGVSTTTPKIKMPARA